MKSQGHHDSQQNHQHGQHIQFQPSLSQGREKTGSHLYPQGIHENNQPETLRVIQHLRIDRQPEMSCHDTHEKHESDAQRHAPHADFS